jgi:hypothetical protein
MRYHWGLGVGHLHAHQFAATSNHILETTRAKDTQGDQMLDCGLAGSEVPGESDISAHHREGDDADDDPDSDAYYDNPEFSLDDRHLEWEDDYDVGSDDGMGLGSDIEEGCEYDDMEVEDFTGV